MSERATVESLKAVGWSHWSSQWYLHPCERHEFGPLSGVDIVVTRDGLNLRVEFDVMNPSQRLCERLVQVLREEA